MRIWQAEHGEAFGDIAFKPPAEVWGGFGISLHQEAQFLIGRGDILGIPYRAQFGSDDTANGMGRGVMDGILRESAFGQPGCRQSNAVEMELAALPGDAAKDRASGGSEPGMVIGGDELDASHSTPDQAIEKGPPMDLGFREGDGDPEQATAAVGSDADG